MSEIKSEKEKLVWASFRKPSPTVLAEIQEATQVSDEEVQGWVSAQTLKKIRLWPANGSAKIQFHRHIYEVLKRASTNFDKAVRLLDSGSAAVIQLPLSLQASQSMQEQDRIVLPLSAMRDEAWDLKQRYVLLSQRGAKMFHLADGVFDARSAGAVVGDVWTSQTKVFNAKKGRTYMPLAGEEGFWQVVYAGPATPAAWPEKQWLDLNLQPKGLYVVLVPARIQVTTESGNVFNVAEAFLQAPLNKTEV